MENVVVLREGKALSAPCLILGLGRAPLLPSIPNPTKFKMCAQEISADVQISKSRQLGPIADTYAVGLKE